MDAEKFRITERKAAGESIYSQIPFTRIQYYIFCFLIYINLTIAPSFLKDTVIYS